MLSELPVEVRLPHEAGNPTGMVHVVAITWIAVPREGRRGGDQRQRSKRTSLHAVRMRFRLSDK